MGGAEADADGDALASFRSGEARSVGAGVLAQMVAAAIATIAATTAVAIRTAFGSDP